MWHIDHPTIERILVFTATYVGQAQVGELIEAQGQVEVEPSGRQRLIVGSSREAHHEYLRVAHTIPRQAASSE
jgi:predicted nucleotidyltransferase